MQRAESLFAADRGELPRTNADLNAFAEPARRREVKIVENLMLVLAYSAKWHPGSHRKIGEDPKMKNDTELLERLCVVRPLMWHDPHATKVTYLRSTDRSQLLYCTYGRYCIYVHVDPVIRVWNYLAYSYLV